MTRALISVIDDDEAVRRTTTFLIEAFRFRAAAFQSAEDFLKSDLLPDTSCLIVDIQMPAMNGLELQRELGRTGCQIPIIFITAYDNRAARERALQAGAVAILAKPFSDQQLLQTVQAALRHDDSATTSM